LNLKQDPAMLLSRMKPKGRYNIGLAQRKGVTVREDSTISASQAFHKVMQEVSARDGFSAEPLAHFAALTETLCPAGLAKIFFAEHEGDILGALLMITFGKRATYLSGGTTNTKRNLMGGYALQWAAINAARKSGCEVYDFWGFDPSVSPEHAYAGFSRFKSQFNGEPINLIGTQDYYFVDHLADAVIRALKEINLFEPAAECV
jgi:peptidoglycan pentaglycine glycine transferase (the first glycine)